MNKYKYLRISILFIGIFLSIIACKQEGTNELERFKKVDSIFANYDSLSPGCAIGIIHKGKLIYSKGYGMADIENQTPNSPEKLFDIASTSKQFTAISILLLEEQGRLSLEDKIRKYIPELPATYESVLVKHLLTHTNGIRDHYALMALIGIDEVSSEKDNWANNHYNDSAVFDIILKQDELNFPPNSYHQYCNSSFYLAGKIIERISGQRLREFYEENLFTPLKMRNTFLYDDETFYHKNRSMGYSIKDDGFRRNLIKYQTYGDGQIITNVNDLYLWDINFYNNKLGEGNPDLIHKAYTKGQLKNGAFIDYSIGGLEVSTYKGLTVIDRMGGTQGISSDIVRFPDQKFTVICLSNTDDLNPDPWRASLKIADIFLNEHFIEDTINNKQTESTETFELSESNLKRFTGLYYNSQNKEIRNINYTNSKLRLGGRELMAFDSNSFKVKGWIATAKFITNSQGEKELHWQSFTNPVEIFSKQERIDYSNSILNEYTGDYSCTELDIDCKIITDTDSLFIIDSNENKSDLTPLFMDAFKTKYNGISVLIEFNRDSTNHITELRMSDDWIKNMKFVMTEWHE